MKTINLYESIGKKAVFGLCLILSLMLGLQPSLAADKNFIRAMEVSKSFAIGQKDLLRVENKFGHIRISYWDRNEVSVRAVIRAQSYDKDRLQELLDHVQVGIEKQGNTVRAKTSISALNTTNESISIEYLISMPADLACSLEQEFGNVYMPVDNRGACNIQVSYGNLNGGNFSGPANFDISFGNLKINDVKNATLKMRYCNGSRLENCQQLHLDMKFSTLKMLNASSLRMSSEHSKLQAGTLDKIHVKSEFDNITIQELKNNLSHEKFAYSEITINKLSPNFEKIDLSGSFSTLNVHIDKKAVFHIHFHDTGNSVCNIEGGFNGPHRFVEGPNSTFTTEGKNHNGKQYEYFFDINGGKKRVINFKGNFNKLNINGLKNP